MKQGSRRRSRGGNRNNLRSKSFDSNGPEVRIRGTASQVYEKYCNLAKDAVAVGDTIMAENYYQHAEHYLRVLNAHNAAVEEDRIRKERNNENRSRNTARQQNTNDMTTDTGKDVDVVPVTAETSQESATA